MAVRAVPRAPNPVSVCGPWSLLAQFLAPLKASVPARIGILSPSWGSPLALKALGEFEDERRSGANGVWGGAPGAGTDPPRAPGRGPGLRVARVMSCGGAARRGGARWGA
ncbi:hypothetical protein GCM10022284_09080 [Streptomyces hundungensis]